MTYSEVWNAHRVGLWYISFLHHLISYCAGAPIQHLKAFLYLPGVSGTSHCPALVWEQKYWGTSAHLDLKAKGSWGQELNRRWASLVLVKQFWASEDGDKLLFPPSPPLLLVNWSLQVILLCKCRRKFSILVKGLLTIRFQSFKMGPVILVSQFLECDPEWGIMIEFDQWQFLCHSEEVLGSYLQSQP